MKLVKKLLLVLAVLLVLFVGVGFLLPSTYHVERSLVVQAKPEAIYAFVAKLSTWEDWTAWNKDLDPNMARTFEGPQEGAGAKMSWSGPKAGNGTFSIKTAEPTTGITYDLDFEHGAYKSTGAIAFERAGDGTKVTWTNGGDLGVNPVNRYFGLLMDRFMGPDFEKGLGKLKGKVEQKK